MICVVLIVFDNSFKSKPLYVTYFIFFHELGHKYYKKEHYADLYAAKHMLNSGFNVTQVLQAPFQSLSAKSMIRAQLLINNFNHA